MKTASAEKNGVFDIVFILNTNTMTKARTFLYGTYTDCDGCVMCTIRYNTPV